MAEVGVRKIVCPAVESPRQGGSLPAARRQIPLQDEDQDDITLRGKVSHILGDDGPAFGPGRRGDLRIIGSPQPHLGNMDGVPAVGIAQQFRRGHRKHLIDQEGCHASSDSRSWAILRLRSAMARLRAIRSRTSPACSEA